MEVNYLKERIMNINHRDVTFEIKVYENDWEYILKGSYLNKIISRCNYNFKRKVLFINNVNNIEQVKDMQVKKFRKVS